MTITARLYQEEAIAKIRELYKQGVRRVVLVMPTGSGKTATLVLMLLAAIRKGSCVLIVCHRKELIDQMSKTLDSLGIDHGIIRGNHWRTRPDLPVQVASISTLIAHRHCPTCIKPRDPFCKVCGGKKKGNGKARRECKACKPLPDPSCVTCGGKGKVRRPLPPAHIVALDECHRALAESNRWLAAEYPQALLYGLTATPWRLDRRGLHPLFDAMVCPITMSALIEQKHLLPLKYYKPYAPDLTGVHLVGGDYDPAELEVAIRKDKKRLGGIVKHWLAKGENQRTLFFSVSIIDAEEVAAKFREAGISAEALSGDTDETLRDAMLARLASGETKVICNCGVLVEGYDLPSLGCVILGRPTKSLTMYLQKVGRCMRPHGDQKYAIILDMAGCVVTHKLPDFPHKWTLEDRKRLRKADAEDVALVECPKCGAVRAQTQRLCPFCRPKQTGLFGATMIEEEEGDLVLVDDERTPVQLTTTVVTSEQKRHTHVCDHCKSDRVRADRHGDLQFKIVCNACKKTSYTIDKDAAKQASVERRRVEYDRLEFVRQSKDLKPGWVSYRYRDLFGTWPPKEWRTPEPFRVTITATIDDEPPPPDDRDFTDDFGEDPTDASL